MNATMDFEFTLWNAESGGTQIGNPVELTSVAVQDGLFNVSVDFGAAAFSGDARWVEIAVRDPLAGPDWEVLDPRQPITATPYALQTRGIYVDEVGQVGIGTNDPRADLHLVGSTTQNTVMVESTSPRGAWLTLFNSSANARAWSLVSTGSENAEGAGHLLFRDSFGGNTDMILTSSGHLGIGTPTAGAPLTVRGATSRGDQVRLYDDGDGSRFAALGVDDQSNFYVQTHQGGVGARGNIVLQGGFPDGAWAGGNVGIGVADPQVKLHVAGRTRTDVLEIVGGSDIAEPFEVNANQAVEPGMVVCIDADAPGKLRLADRSYDATVAGVISGAGGVRTGLTLRQEGTIADGSLPVALSGRVYCYVDADAGGPVQPGDLLTTSDTPGHAMKAVDGERSRGAILGKAMTAFESGRGLVLALVSLQ